MKAIASYCDTGALFTVQLLNLDSLGSEKLELKIKRIKKCHLFNNQGSLVPERAYSILDFSVGSTLAWYLCHINSHSSIPPNLMAVWYTMSRIWGEMVRLERNGTLTNKYYYTSDSLWKIWLVETFEAPFPRSTRGFHMTSQKFKLKNCWSS